MKTLPRFSLNLFYKIILGTALLCPLYLTAQDTPLATPLKTEYPGIIQTFEKLIQIDGDKFQKRLTLMTRDGNIFNANSNVTNLDLEPDFLNSLILHSNPGYIRLASSDKCRFYDTILTDLLRSSEGKIKNVMVTYLEKDRRMSALIPRRDFLNKVVNQECPQTQKTIASFQIKTVQKTLGEIAFDIPTGMEQCRNIHVNWLNNPNTPYLCQIYEFVRESKLGQGDPKDLEQRKTMARILDEKMSLVQKEYVENLCQNLDNEDLFCEEFLNVSFWTKIAAGFESKIYAEDICSSILNTQTLSSSQFSICLGRMKKEKDLCLYPGQMNSGLRPQPDCDQLSTALNFSSFKTQFKDCPGNSDQMIVTNMGRILSHFGSGAAPVEQGPCQSYSAATVFGWNRQMDNDVNWNLEACFEDRLLGRDICKKMIFADYPKMPESYTTVVEEILRATRGADLSVKCKMIESSRYNPLMLEFKSGCWIVFEKENCFISECKHKVFYNDRSIDLIKIKGSVALAYFPLNIRDERFSQNYILTHEYKKTPKQLATLNAMTAYFKKSKSGIVHGVGCGEELLPSFFKANTINQCTAIPFTISGMMKDGEKIVFVIRTAADSAQAPRLLSWSLLYSAVKTYQRTHPLKLWTMYGLD